MMKSRIVLFVTLLLLIFHCTACRNDTNRLQQKFSECAPNNSVVAVLDHCVFYFTDHILNLGDMVKEENPNHGYLFLNGKLYFSTSKQNEMWDFSLFVYECDVYGNNKHLVFEKHGYKTKPWAIGKQGVLYFEYYETNALDASSRRIDSYDILNGVYENVSSGTSSSLSDYRKDTTGSYSWEVENGILVITDSKKNQNYQIDHETLNGSEFSEALAELEYSFSSCNVMDDGQIYLVYRIKSNGSPYPHFICEYLPETDEVVFQSLIFPYDVKGISVEKVW